MSDIEERFKIEKEKEFRRQLIDGCLNRISITDDDNERINMVYF